MRSDHTRRLVGIAGLAVGLALATGQASADPLGFSVNRDSHDVSVVDLTTRATRRTIGTLMQGANDPGSSPNDVVVDPKSGRTYVATSFRLVHFDGRLAIGATQPVASANTLDKGTGLALDATGRRLFMCHGDLPGLSYGVIEQFSLANPAKPQLVVPETHVAVSAGGSTNLRFIAFDAYFQRLYVVADDGIVYRTPRDNVTSFTEVARGAVSPSGILADPKGGVWISSRNPGNLIRISEAGLSSTFAVGSDLPRGLAFDPAGSGSILVAVDSLNAIRRFRPNLSSFDAANAMTTAENPQDVALTTAGSIVSLNRRTNIGTGNVTVAGVSQPVDTTGQRSLALAVLDVAKLTPTPASHAFCWNQAGDSGAKQFTIQNTRLDQMGVDMAPVTIAGSNPNNYMLIGANTCNAARLKWGASCQFTVQFTAAGACVQPPSPIFPQICYWPAEVVVSNTTGTATARIPVSGRVAALPCP